VLGEMHPSRAHRRIDCGDAPARLATAPLGKDRRDDRYQPCHHRNRRKAKSLPLHRIIRPTVIRRWGVTGLLE
jgi:hypothetical protein